jgi:ethanolamine transporter EutH
MEQAPASPELLQHTFFPGFPSTSPTTFSLLPTILSTTFSVFVRGFLTVVVVVVVVVFGLATRPEATARGLLVFAFVVFLGAMTDSMA